MRREAAERFRGAFEHLERGIDGPGILWFVLGWMQVGAFLISHSLLPATGFFWIGIAVSRIFVRGMPKKDTVAFRMAHEDDKPTYCEDCGQRYIRWTRQDGFNAKTGEPRRVAFMACPDHDPESVQASAYMAFGFPSRACGKRVVTKAVAYAHNHDNEKQVSSTCPGCIDRMIKEGVVSRKEGRKMISMLS